MTSSTTRSTCVSANRRSASSPSRAWTTVYPSRSSGYVSRVWIDSSSSTRRIVEECWASERSRGLAVAGAPTIARRWKRLGPGRAVAGCVAALLNAPLTHGSCGWDSSSSSPRFSHFCSPSRQRERFRDRRSTRSSTARRPPRSPRRSRSSTRPASPGSEGAAERRAGIARRSRRSASRPRRTSGSEELAGPRPRRAPQRRHRRARTLGGGDRPRCSSRQRRSRRSRSARTRPEPPRSSSSLADSRRRSSGRTHCRSDTLVLVSTDAGAFGGAGAARFATSSPLARRRDRRRRPRRPRRRSPATGDRRRHARLPRAHARPDRCRTGHRGGRRQPSLPSRPDAARRPRRAVRARRAGPLPRRRSCRRSR